MPSELSTPDTEAMAYHVLKSAMAMFQQTPAALSDAQRRQATKTARKSWELESKILSSPEAQGIAIPAQSIQKAVNDVKERYETADEYLQDLADNGLTTETLYLSLRRDLWVEAVMDRVSVSAIDVTDAEIKDFYDANIEKFVKPETRLIRHILITVNDEYKENTEDAVQQRLADIQAELRKGASFEELAARHSECPTSMNGGEVGRIPQGQLYPEVDAVAFSLKAGAVGGPALSEIGYHLVKCEEISPGGHISLEDARNKITEYLHEKKGQSAQAAWLRSL